MADMEFTVDYSDILQATKAAQRLEKDFSELSKVAGLGAASHDKLLQTFNRLQQSGNSLSQVYKSMERDEKMAAKAAADLEAAHLKSSLSGRTRTQAMQDMQEAIRESARAEREAAKEAEAQARELDRLRTKYNPLYAASKQYEKALEDLSLAHQRGVLTTKQHEDAVENLNMEYQQFQKGTAGWSNQFVQGAQRSARSMNRMGMVTQQVGYQVGDFLVQIQSGTNWMVAFGQQATQLAGLISGRFVALGAALGIAIPLVTAVGAAFMRTKGNAEDAEESYKNLNSTLEQLEGRSLDSFGEGLVGYAAEARKEFETILDIMDQVGRRQLDAILQGPTQDIIAQLERNVAASSVAGQLGLEEPDFDYLGLKTRNEALFLAAQLKQLDGETKEELQGQLEFITQAVNLRGIMTDEVGALLAKLATELEVSKSIQTEAEKKQQAFMDQLNSMEIIIDRANEELDLYRSISYESSGIINKAEQTSKLKSLEVAYGRDSMEYLSKVQEYERQALEHRIKSEGISGELADKLRSALGFAQDIATTDMASGINAAATAASTLANNLATAAANAVAARDAYSEYLAQQEFDTNMPPGGTMMPVGGGLTPLDIEVGGTDEFLPPGQIGNKPKKTKRGGGSGAASERQSQLEAFIASLQTEREALDAWYLEQQEMLAMFNEQELEAIGGHNEAKLRIEQEYQERLADLQSGYQGDALERTQTFMGEMASALAGGNEKMMQISKVFASVEALINAYRAYNQVLADPSLPWYAKIPAAVSVLSAGLKTVQSIKSATSGSSGSSGGGSGGSSIRTPEVQENRPQEVIIRGLTPGMRLTPEELQEVFDQMQEENNRRGYVFRVANN